MKKKQNKLKKRMKNFVIKLKKVVVFIKSEKKKLLVASSCVIGTFGLAYYANISSTQPLFSTLLAAESTITLNAEISDEAEKRRKCTQLIKQFKVRW